MSTQDTPTQKEINMIMSVAEQLLVAIAPKVIESFVESMCYTSRTKSGARLLFRELKTIEDMPSIDEIYGKFLETHGVGMAGLRPVVQQELRKIAQRHYDYITGTTR